MLPYGRQLIDEEDINEVVNVLKSDWLTTGPKVTEFENEICNYIGCKHAIVVNSGTSALDIAVGSLGLPEGSEIITTPFTFMATSNSIIYNNLIPVFADIKEDTFNIDPESIKRKITPHTKAIIYVDYAGQPCDIKEIKKIAIEHDLYLIEDASHALGASYNGKKVGNFADMTVFSFHPVKPITTGEGGAVVTDNDELAHKLRLLHSHGIDKDAASRYGPNAGWAYDMKMLGRNYRMTDIQAALGISQLKKLDRFIERRNEISLMYEDFIGGSDLLETPKAIGDIVHGWHLYPVILNDSIDRDIFFKHMRSSGIGVNVHYIPIYKFTFYKENYPSRSIDFPMTEKVFSRIITLPIHPSMSDDDVEFVVDKINEWK